MRGEEEPNAAVREYGDGTEGRDEGPTRASVAQRERRVAERPKEARDERRTTDQPTDEQG